MSDWMNDTRDGRRFSWAQNRCELLVYSMKSNNSDSCVPSWVPWVSGPDPNKWVFACPMNWIVA